MKRFVLGVLVGMLLTAGIAGAAKVPLKAENKLLSLWEGDGARPGLYSSHDYAVYNKGKHLFFECRAIGPAKITPPPSPKP